jgi:penicillin-binding protein 2
MLGPVHAGSVPPSRPPRPVTIPDPGRTRRSPVRFLAFGLAVAVVLGTFTARLAYLQVAQGGYYVGQAAANMAALEPIPSTRGIIVDANGRPLVENVPTFAVEVIPADLPFSQRPAIVTRLAQLLHLSITQINETIDASAGAVFDGVKVATNVSQATAQLIAEDHLELPGVQVVVDSRRDYLYGSLLSQILGYTGPISADQLRLLQSQGYLANDAIGQVGLEAQYEQQLRGTYGVQQIERDATGRPLQVLSTLQQPQAGDTLQLSIDLKTQEQAQTALQWAMQTAGIRKGVVIVMNPQTGEVLAMVSLPTYDDNLFEQGMSLQTYAALADNPDHPLLDHAIGEIYPPGSTYKLVTGSAVLADGKLGPDQTLQTYGHLTLDGQRFNDWNGVGFGPLTVAGAYAQSSDTFFYQAAALVGIDRLAYYAHQFGFGSPTGIDLPGEATGIVPSNEWKMQTFGESIFPGETYLAGIGQGYDAVTPIELLDAYCAMINGGRLLQPQIVRQVTAPDGQVVQAFAPKVRWTVNVPPSVLTYMREAAREAVVIRHTGNVVDMPLYVAGKTGTAEFGNVKIGGNLPFHSWFVGFVSPSGNFAKTDSQLAILAFTDNTSNSIGNPSTELVKYFLQMHYGIKQDYRQPFLIRPIG